MLNPLEYLDYYRNLNAYNIVGIPNFVTKIFGKKLSATVSNIIVKISKVENICNHTCVLNLVLSFFKN